MKRFAILGYPLGHTLSPKLHRLLAEQLGEQIEYSICAIPPEELEEHFEELFCLDGFNITIPYKVRLMEQLDQLDTSARNHGAVNVVSIAADGKRCGYNTDCIGFVRTMQSHGVPIAGRCAGSRWRGQNVCHRVRSARLYRDLSSPGSFDESGRAGGSTHPFVGCTGKGRGHGHRAARRQSGV